MLSGSSRSLNEDLHTEPTQLFTLSRLCVMLLLLLLLESCIFNVLFKQKKKEIRTELSFVCVNVHKCLHTYAKTELTHVGLKEK